MEEAFSTGVVIAVAFGTHTADQLVTTSRISGTVVSTLLYRSRELQMPDGQGSFFSKSFQSLALCLS
jgi:hypothetical protein